MEYTEVQFICSEPEIAMAYLAEIGFDSFAESDSGFMAYIPSRLFDENTIRKTLFTNNVQCRFSWKQLEDINWNQVWESNYEPVTIAGQCYVRAPFHPSKPEAGLEIIIEPKMSFGTAHHETTSLMIEIILSMQLKDKDILDMGCGTGILAILAEKRQAHSVDAIDNDEWAYNNTLENINNNHRSKIKAALGDANLLIKNVYDVVFANINRNILLNDMAKYAGSLKNGGILLMSGFYQNDIAAIEAEATKNNLKIDFYHTKNDWTAVHCTLNR
jgi:ribosomal protein L11 methyltransferase